MIDNIVDQFIESAKRVGTEVVRMENLPDAVAYISEKVEGTTLIPETTLTKRHGLRALITKTGIDVFAGRFRDAGQVPGA